MMWFDLYIRVLRRVSIQRPRRQYKKPRALCVFRHMFPVSPLCSTFAIMVSIANVMAILKERFPDSGDSRIATRVDRNLANTIISLLESHQSDDVELQISDERMLDVVYNSVDPDYDPIDDEEDAVPSIEPETGNCVRFSGDNLIHVEQVRRAVAFYFLAQKGHRSLESMKSKFRFIKTGNDLTKLRAFRKDEEATVDRRKKLQDLHHLLFETFISKCHDGVPLHDVNLRAIALTINQELKIKNFKASQRWITQFKKAHGIVSRRITKFVSRKTLMNRASIETKAEALVAEVRRQNFEPCEIVNADQSGFIKEMYAARTLASIGVRHVERIVQSVSSTTHSYTVMPMIYANGTLNPKLFVVLQEHNGRFPEKFDRHAFKNIVVRCHSSHIMTKELMKEWLHTCILTPEMPDKLLLLVDSWTGFKDHDAIKAMVPEGKELRIHNIPPGATSFIQPLDVFFFRVFKDFMKRIHTHVLACSIEFIIAKRENILHVLEVIWNQFCHPRFRPFLQYSWRKAGYIDGEDEEFKTPVEVCFDPTVMEKLCADEDCSHATFIRCCHCSRHLCFDHFVVKRHYH